MATILKNEELTNASIIKHFSNIEMSASFIDKLKIKYRPLICPFLTLLKYVENNHVTAFDIGCGSGQFSSLLARFTNLKEIEGVDIDIKLINNANKLANNFNFEKKLKFNLYNGEILPNSINNSDIIFLIDVLHHIHKSSQIAFLNEIFNKMKSGATFVLKDIDGSSPLVCFNKAHDFIFSGEFGSELGFDFAKEEILKSGFLIKDSFKQSVFVYPHYFFICEKP